jgi:hypothetical protein
MYNYVEEAWRHTWVRTDAILTFFGPALIAAIEISAINLNKCIIVITAGTLTCVKNDG